MSQLERIKEKRLRLSVDVTPEEHRRIKICAALHNESVRSYVIKAVKERIKGDMNLEMLQLMTAKSDPLLAELWDNEKDSEYDGL